MQSVLHLKASVAMLLSVPLAACAHTSISNDVPNCERLIPPALKVRVLATDIPVPVLHEDGHQDAEPWMIGFLEQTGQLDKANDRGDGIEHIYATCLDEHRKALKRAQRGFFGRLFG